MNGWLIALLLVNLYAILVYGLIRSGKMEKWNLSLMFGFVLMIRTTRGRRTLEKVAKPRRFWNAFGDLGIATTLVFMVLMALLTVWVMWISLQPRSGIEAFGVSEILVIPGVNPFVPLGYGLLALAVTLIVHEGGHGVLAIANKLRVKSLGLLYAIVPIGAFVEPDEEQLQQATRRQRMRVYAAGPMVNIVVATITILAFGGLLASAIPMEGAAIGQVVGNPANDAGIVPGDLFIEANGVFLNDWQDFLEVLDPLRPGDQVELTLADGTNTTAILGSRWDTLTPEQQDRVLDENATLAEELANDGFLGVAPFLTAAEHERASKPLGSLGNFLFLMSLPIQEVRGSPYLGFYYETFFETPFDSGVFWVLTSSLFWIFWINLMVGLTNVLPLGILDGGALFRDSITWVSEKLRPTWSPEARAAAVARSSRTVSYVMFFAILLQILGPRIAQLYS